MLNRAPEPEQDHGAGLPVAGAAVRGDAGPAERRRQDALHQPGVEPLRLRLLLPRPGQVHARGARRRRPDVVQGQDRRRRLPLPARARRQGALRARVRAAALPLPQHLQQQPEVLTLSRWP